MHRRMQVTFDVLKINTDQDSKADSAAQAVSEAFDRIARDSVVEVTDLDSGETFVVFLQDGKIDSLVPAVSGPNRRVRA